ncbi:hypothetical protein [Streptomyces sp. WMMC940]|uniref:hypothetical protein n=1 Tax=Streptomyces sp. WMMC940 TaxID=3015153 RepID=UPI0022B6DADC|nr:hypothetical protein [Streptomyces sp. WMMC940]MCZ7462276.1 hypothetical protein [Streptomyces sp. WMMC940]
MILRRQGDDVDVESVRSAVRHIIESRRFDGWLIEMPDHVLVQVAAPLEMLGFQHYMTPPQDRLLVRAARVVWDAVAGLLDDCPADLAEGFASLGAALSAAPAVARGQEWAPSQPLQRRTGVSPCTTQGLNSTGPAPGGPTPPGSPG